MSAVELSGGCLCGGVTYRLSGPLRNVINCFCEQCRKTSGHHVAASSVLLENFEITANQTLQWYPSSDNAKRGFCNHCGSSLFWQLDGRDNISVMAGTIDGPTGLKSVENIFTDDMSDYHTLPIVERSE